MWHAPAERLLRMVPLLAALTAAPPVSAQVVQGLLLDEATGQPVASATIQLLRGESDFVLGTDVTDDLGHFMLQAPTSGMYRLRAARIGYQPVATELFEIVYGEDPVEAELRISAVAVPLEPLDIVSERVSRTTSLRLEIVDYYTRRELYGREGMGVGQFLDREGIRATNPTRVSDALRTVTGVVVKGAGGMRQLITLRGGCVPDVYVDGVQAATGRDIDKMLSPWSLAAIEVYPGLVVPPEFLRSGRGGCGAIALWTGYVAEENPAPEPAAPATDQALVAKSAQLALNLTLATDSVTLSDTLHTTVTISNLSDDTKSLCILDSRYTLRGTDANRDVVDMIGSGSCVPDGSLAPRATRTWHDAVTFLAALDDPGQVLIQKHIRLRYEPCGGGKCEVLLRSEPRWFTIHR